MVMLVQGKVRKLTHDTEIISGDTLNADLTFFLHSLDHIITVIPPGATLKFEVELFKVDG